MGNDLVGQVVDKFKEFRPNKTPMKIWNKNKLCVILGVNDPNDWENEMDPYYIYSDGKIDGVSFLDNAEVLDKIMKPEYLIYHDPKISE